MDSVRKALSLFYQRSDWVRFERLLDQTPARIKAVVLNNVDQESLLHRAVTDVDLPIIQLLFKHGADPHCIEDDMNLLTTLVRHCMKRGSWLEVAKLLVERVQMDPDTLLSAVDNSFYEMLEYLLSTDAVIEQRHIDHQNTSRQTCLHRAAIRGDAAFTLLLLSHGAHAKLRDQNAQTALMMAQEASAYRVEVGRKSL
jgi:ankyrin repeat protein